MSVLDFDLHRLYVLNTTDGYEDEDGHYHKGTSEWEDYMECDVMPASTNKNVINLEDGRQEYYTYTVYLSTECRDFKYGELVRLEHFGKMSPVYMVKGFQRYQLQCLLIIGKNGN